MKKSEVYAVQGQGSSYKSYRCPRWPCPGRGHLRSAQDTPGLFDSATISQSPATSASPPVASCMAASIFTVTAFLLLMATLMFATVYAPVLIADRISGRRSKLSISPRAAAAQAKAQSSWGDKDQ